MATGIYWREPAACFMREMLLDLPPEASFFYRSTNNMCQPMISPPLMSPSAFDWEYTSEDVIVVGDEKSKHFILAGALSAFRSQTYFTLVRRGRLHSIIAKQPDIKPDKQPEELVVLEGDDWRTLLTDYADRVAKTMNVKPINTAKNIVGYCSWYYYYADVTEQNFLDNIDALVANQKAFPAQYAQIDDGYQTFQGDWLDQDASWPTPLSEIGAKIQKSGMTGGIWLMPFLASTASRIFREHPEYFVRDRNDQPLRINGWSPPPDNYWVCLDTTQPAVREHMKKTFQSLYDMGFHFFKMDGLGYGIPCGKRSDPNATAISAYRLGLQTITEAVPEATLLGCGAPVMPSLGFIHHNRVSADTGRAWEVSMAIPNSPPPAGAPSIVSALHGSLCNWWMFDRFFRAAPDALMARQDNAFYTIGEARLSILTGIVTGVAVTSDNLSTIAPDRLELLQKAAVLRLHNPRPALWEPDSFVQVFEGTCDGRHAIAVFNDSRITMNYNLAELGFHGPVEELIGGGTIQNGILTLPEHDAALVRRK